MLGRIRAHAVFRVPSDVFVNERERSIPDLIALRYGNVSFTQPPDLAR